MSTFSLPRLINGGGCSKNSSFNYKFATLNGRGSIPTEAQVNFKRQTLSKCETDFLERRKAVNRRGSIARNQFRGIKGEHLERQTKKILHSLTVGLLLCVLIK